MANKFKRGDRVEVHHMRPIISRATVVKKSPYLSDGYSLRFDDGSRSDIFTHFIKPLNPLDLIVEKL